MHRRTAAVTLSAVAIAAALGLGACGGDGEHTQPEGMAADSPTAIADQQPVAPPPAPLPPPTALTEVMNRIADANIPGADKTALIESPTAADTAAMDKFGQALRQNGYTPMAFEIRDLRWVQGTADTVSALVSLKTANPQAGDFSYPMDFILTDNSWRLSRRSADELLQPGAPEPQTPSPTTTPNPPR